MRNFIKDPSPTRSPLNSVNLLTKNCEQYYLKQYIIKLNKSFIKYNRYKNIIYRLDFVRIVKFCNIQSNVFHNSGKWRKITL